MRKDQISILIVDDDKDLLDMYRDIFEMDGFKIFTALSGREALEIYKNNLDIRLVISDSHMEGMSGLELLKNLKDTYKAIPLFYLATGSVEKDDDDVKSLGGSGLVLKPFDVDEILVRIKKDLKL